MLVFYLAVLEQPGDADAFVVLYHKYLPMLTGIALKYFSDHRLVEDALQETWEDIAKNFIKISSIPCHELPSYLVTIMKNNCIDILRKEKKYAEMFPDEDVAADDETSDTVHIQEEYRRLVALIRATPVLYREVLERRLVLEQSNQEVAKALKISENLAAKRYERGRAMLIKTLRNEEAGHDQHRLG